MPALSAANLLWLGMPVFSAPPRLRVSLQFLFPYRRLAQLEGVFYRYSFIANASYLRLNLEALWAGLGAFWCQLGAPVGGLLGRPEGVESTFQGLKAGKPPTNLEKPRANLPQTSRNLP